MFSHLEYICYMIQKGTYSFAVYFWSRIGQALAGPLYKW